jgi:hypothetical protein
MFKKIFSGLSITMVIFSLSSVGTARLAKASEPDAQKKWSKLSEAQKQVLRDEYSKWQTLSPEKKSELKKHYEAFKKLSPAQQFKMEENYKKFKSLPPAKQQIAIKLTRVNAESFVFLS